MHGSTKGDKPYEIKGNFSVYRSQT